LPAASPIDFVTMVSEWFFLSNIPGDLNDDTLLDILDVVLAINIIMGFVEPTDVQLITGDMNNDGTINVLDILVMVNLIIGVN